MSFKDVLHTEIVEEDLQNAYDWYESKIVGLGEAFLNEVDDFSRRLVKHPFTHKEIAKGIRMGQLNRFPYLVYYEVFESEILILSVVYGGRHPEYWKKRKL